MQPRALLIGITKIDWEIFTKVCKETLKISPVTIVDEKGIGTNKPYSFCVSLEGFTENIEPTYEHILINFFVQLDPIDSYMIAEQGAKSIKIQEDRHMMTFVVSGSLKSFYEYVISKSKNNAEAALKHAYYHNLAKNGFKTIFKGLNTTIENGITRLSK